MSELDEKMKKKAITFAFKLGWVYDCQLFSEHELYSRKNESNSLRKTGFRPEGNNFTDNHTKKCCLRAFLWNHCCEGVRWCSCSVKQVYIYSHTQTWCRVSNWCNINKMNKISLCQTSCHCCWHEVIRSAACHGENMRKHACLILRSRLSHRPGGDGALYYSAI